MATTSDSSTFIELVGRDHRTRHLMRWNAEWKSGTDCWGGIGLAPGEGWPALCGAVGLKVSDVKPKRELEPCTRCQTEATSQETRRRR